MSVTPHQPFWPEREPQPLLPAKPFDGPHVSCCQLVEGGAPLRSGSPTETVPARADRAAGAGGIAGWQGVEGAAAEVAATVLVAAAVAVVPEVAAAVAALRRWRW